MDDLLMLYAEPAAGAMSEVTTAVRELTGGEPRTFDAFLAQAREIPTPGISRGGGG
ncbi:MULTISPECIES: hypothetical protein [Streptomyces]|uniref:hypothetical protein n=1 Tax=Streptomyces TaxID=1883 RepID=UPI001678B8AB|nr:MULTISPECIES: hypothetical protein [Streptomyces]WGP08906.1 hypothetical protein QFA72_04090 [Streptomyces sp. SH5]